MKYLIFFLFLSVPSATFSGSIEVDNIYHSRDSTAAGNPHRTLPAEDCVLDYLLSNNEVNSNFTYHAANRITTNNSFSVTKANNELVLKAGKSIVLKPGSVIQSGALFLARIEPCIPCSLDFTYPKFFTPNEDTYNDTWQINWADVAEASRVSIFDRYGKLVEVLDDPSDNWDGTYSASKLSSDDYWFMLEYIDCNGNEKIYKSHFSLKR